MKKIFAGFILPLLILSFTGLSSCKDRAVSKEQKMALDEKKDTLLGEIETHIYPLPTSAEVIKMLTELEVGFQFGITNPVENSKKYFNSSSRAINLGVYGADLSYSTLYNQEQKVIEYLDVIGTLANELNMSQIYDQEMYTKIKDNIDNKDALVEILENAFNETYAYLADKDQQPEALLVVGGAWVEGMYLTTHVSEAAYQVEGISRVLLEQKGSFDTFIEITGPFMTNEMVSNFVNNLDPIKKVYAGLGTSLTEQNIKDITNAIVEIREQIVK